MSSRLTKLLAISSLILLAYPSLDGQIKFKDVTARSNLYFEDPFLGRSTMFFDYDGDGLPDLAGPAIFEDRTALAGLVFIYVDTISCSITGIPGFEVQNVTLRDISISFEGEGADRPVVVEVPESESDYPESKMFGKLPAYGIYARHVRNISLHNVRLDHEKEEQRPALVFDDVEGLGLNDLHLEEPTGEGPSVVYINTCNIISDRDY